MKIFAGTTFGKKDFDGLFISISACVYNRTIKNNSRTIFRNEIMIQVQFYFLQIFSEEFFC